MKITGSNLRLVRYGIELALDERHNQIATCPNVIEYADSIALIEAEQMTFKKLLARIDAALKKEIPNGVTS